MKAKIMVNNNVKRTCLDTDEMQSMVDRFHAMLVDIQDHLEAKEPHMISSLNAVQEHMQNLTRMHAFLTQQQANDHCP